MANSDGSIAGGAFEHAGPAAWSGLRLGIVSLWLMACSPAAEEAPPVFRVAGPIHAGEAVTIPWVPGDDMEVLVQVRQVGADLRLSIRTPPDVALVGPVDNGLFRDGTERAVVAVDAGSTVEIILGAGEDVASDAGYAVELFELPAAGASDAARIDGLRALTRAGTALALGTSASRETAEAELDTALEAFDARGSERERAATTYMLAMLRYAWFYRWSESAAEFADASRQFERLGETQLAAQALLWHGAALAETQYLDAAREQIDEAHRRLSEIDAAYDTAFAVNMQGYVATKQGRYADSIASYSAARDAFAGMGETIRLGLVQSNLALDAMRAGRLREAVEEIERSASNLRGRGEQRLLAETLLNLAWVRVQTGDLGGARATYLEAREAFRSIDDRSGELYTTNGLALTYAQAGELTAAARLFDEVAAGAAEQDDRDLELAGLTFAGNLLRDEGEVEAAISRHTRMLRRSRSDLERAKAQLQLGLDEAARGDHSAAIDRFEQAELQMATVALAPLISMQLDLALGTALLERAVIDGSDLMPARVRLDRAAAQARTHGRAGARVEALHALARLYAASGEPDTAMTHLDRALDSLRDLRAQIPGGHMRWSHAGAQRPRYMEQVDLLMRLAVDADSPVAHALQLRALEVSEEAHAVALAEFIEGGSGPDGAAASIRQRLGELRVRLDGTPADALELRAPLEAEIRELSIALDRSWEAEDWPVRRAGVSSAEIQSLLAEQDAADAALVEILLGDHRSFAWVVTASDVRVVQLGAREAIERAALATFSGLSRRQVGIDDGAAQALRELSRLLVEPIFPGDMPSQIIFVADGALKLVPFDAIPHPAGGTLIDHSETTRAPSAAVLTLLRSAGSAGRSTAMDRASTGLLAMADPVGETTDEVVMGLSRLPGAVDEAQLAASAARAMGMPATVLTGADADLRSLQELASDVEILHLATHGRIDLARPWSSGLLLADAGSRRLIGPTDLLTLDLNAELVVLSACDASRGTLAGGEGAMSLAQSFLAMGVPRVVSTLWQVEDASAALLMEAFYQGLQQGLRPSAALRRAKLALRDSGGRGGDPAQWAAFEFIGLPTGLPAARREGH